MKKYFSLILSVMLILAFAVPSFAAETKVASKQILEMQRVLEAEGISPETQETLMEKLRNGVLWDNVNPAKKDLIPNDYFTFASDEIGEKKFVFPDGSFIKIAVEKPSHSGSKLIINDTQTFTGTNLFSTIKVKADLMMTDTNESRFVKVYKPLDITGIGASISDITDGYIRKVQSGNNPAHYRVNYRINTAISPYLSVMMQFDCYVAEFETSCNLSQL